MKEDPLYPADTSTDESPSPVSTSTANVGLPGDDKRFDQGKDTDSCHALERHDRDNNGDLTFHTNQELPAPDDSHNEQYSAAFSDRHESAVRGLLALGCSNNGIAMRTLSATPGLPVLDHTLTLSPLSTSTRHQDPSPQSLSYIDTANGDGVVSDLPAVDCPSLSESERLELLRNYRYHVAPWVRLFMRPDMLGPNVFDEARYL